MSKLDLTKLLEKGVTRKEFLQLGLVTGVSLFAATAVLRELLSQAATSSASSEAETALLSGGAALVNDPNASGGQAVNFGLSGLQAGSVPVGTAQYAVPATGAVWVSPSGNDTSGTGTQASPFRTITKAIATAAAGSTIVLKRGEYQEVLNTSKSLTIQNAPGEDVWLDGSQVLSGWSNNGNGTWSAPYTVNFTRHDVSRYPGDDPYRGYVDQVWVNGVALTQIADGATPSSGQFSVNQTTDRLTVAVDPTGKEIRASKLSTGTITGKVTLRGIGFRRFSPTYVEWNELGANAFLIFGGTSTDSLIENCVFEHSSMSAITTARKITIRSVTIQDCGQSGILGNTANDLVIDKVLVRRYNRNQWQAEPITAAIKLARCTGLTISNCYVEDGPGAYGIWLDVTCTRYQIINNKVVGNTGLAASDTMDKGILTELSDGGKFNGTQYYGIIAGNEVTGCKVGIILFDSGYCKVFNNDVRNCDIGVYLWQDNRHNTSNVYLTYQECPWITKGVHVANNIFDTTTTFPKWRIQFIVHDNADGGAPQMLGGQMFDHLGGNWFYATTSGSMAQLGKIDGSRNAYNTVEALAAAGTEVGGPLSAKLGTNYRGTTAPPASIATAVPNDVAAALGIAAGTKQVGPPVARPVPIS